METPEISIEEWLDIENAIQTIRDRIIEKVGNAMIGDEIKFELTVKIRRK